MPVVLPLQWSDLVKLAILHLRAEYSALDAHIDAVVDVLPKWARSDEVRVGLGEALSNAIVHGALRVPPREEEDFERFLDDLLAAEARAAGATITVAVLAVGKRLLFAVADGGPGFDWKRARRRDRRGLGILDRAFAGVSWNARGNVLLASVERPS